MTSSSKDAHSEPTLQRLSTLCREQLSLMGEDPDREGLLKTPDRVARTVQYLTSGYHEDPVVTLRSALFHEPSPRMVMLKDIEFYSLCEHHIMPFFGKVHVAYIPDGTITGLSKIARAVDILSKRLQVQERLTTQLLQVIGEALQPKGAMVVIEAQHLCMQMRGVEKQGTMTRTMDYTGLFASDSALRQDFMSSIRPMP